MPSRASPVFFNTFLPVRRRTSSAAGATTERQCSLQGAELAPRREEQTGSEVGGRCTPQNALADCSSSQLALSQRRCARAVRCFTLCAGNVRARAAVGSRNECGHAAAARRPLWWRRRFRSKIGGRRAAAWPPLREVPLPAASSSKLAACANQSDSWPEQRQASTAWLVSWAWRATTSEQLDDRTAAPSGSSWRWLLRALRGQLQPERYALTS